jgi:hypothetical protein
MRKLEIPINKKQTREKKCYNNIANKRFRVEVKLTNKVKKK